MKTSGCPGADFNEQPKRPLGCHHHHHHHTDHQQQQQVEPQRRDVDVASNNSASIVTAQHVHDARPSSIPAITRLRDTVVPRTGPTAGRRGNNPAARSSGQLLASLSDAISRRLNCNLMVSLLSQQHVEERPRDDNTLFCHWLILCL